MPAIFRHGVPVMADGIAFLLAVLLLPAVITQLDSPSGLNALLIGIAYTLFCTAVYTIKKLESEPEIAGAGSSRLPLPGRLLAPATQRLLGVLFSLGITFLIADQLGYINAIQIADPNVLGSGESSAFFVFAPGAWLGTALFYVLVLGSTVRTTVKWQSDRYPWLALAALVGVNGMLLLATAEIHTLLRPTNLAAPVLIPASFGLLLLLFGPPRWWYFSKRPMLTSIITFLPLLAYCAWRIGA